MSIVLRPHQIAAPDAVEAAWRSGIKRPLVDACVASGKSYMMAELARREVERGGRALILSHTRELVEQNANACRLLMPGVHVGINAAALGERTWRAPVISAAIQSVFRDTQSFGPITNVLADECHLWPHSESGMYRQLARGLPHARVSGFSGTVFRLQGGSLTEGEGAPFDRVVYRYGILDGIRDGYLCPAFCADADDVVDVSKLRTRQGEYTSESQDAQMIASIDNHIAQMVHHGAERKRWLVFEAGTKAARAMAARMNEWGIPTGLVLGETPAHERAATIAAYRAGRLRALVNVFALCVGFDVPEVDMLVMRFKTKSLGKYIQVIGRLLRTIGGNLLASIAAGKADGLLLDFGGNVDDHGPLDFLRPKETTSRLVSCDECNTRNAAAAARCWSCDAPMTKLCPACLVAIRKGELDCPHCAHDMRVERSEAAPAKLHDMPSGAALIASWKGGASERAGGWIPVRKAYAGEGGVFVDTLDARLPLLAPLAAHAETARWLRVGLDGAVAALLVPNGTSRSSARQIGADGSEVIVPMPDAVERQEASAVGAAGAEQGSN